MKIVSTFTCGGCGRTSEPVEQPQRGPYVCNAAAQPPLGWATVHVILDMPAPPDPRMRELREGQARAQQAMAELLRKAPLSPTDEQASGGFHG